MGKYLIIIFLLIILAYVIAIVVQKIKGRNDVQLHMTRRERDRLIDEIESIEIPELKGWIKSSQDDPEIENDENAPG
jgi:hypothetical protein